MPERDGFEPDEQERDEQVLDALMGKSPFASTTMPVGDPVKLDAQIAAPQQGSQGPPPRTPVQASTYTGVTPQHAFEGFNFDREQNTGKSAKDAFAFLANQAPPPPIHDKNALGQWFNTHILPGMNDLGHGAQEAQGDKFRFKNWQGEYDVDFGRGAGAEGGALAWMADPTTGAVTQAPGPAISGGAGLPATGGGEDSALERILAEIDAAANGGASQFDQDILRQLMER